jgi:hypothetical protein
VPFKSSHAVLDQVGLSATTGRSAPPEIAKTAESLAEAVGARGVLAQVSELRAQA